MNLSPWASVAAWVFLVLWTVFLSPLGVLLWPFTFIFEQGSGRLIHGVSQLWARVVACALPFWEVKADGLQNIKKERPYVIVSNHQSILDIMVVLAKMPLHFKFVAKRELFWIPFFGWHLALARYIALKRGDRQSGHAALEKAREWIRRGVSVLLFPEGTRSPDGQIHEFKAGAFKLAIEEKADLLPIVITGTGDAIPKHSLFVKKKSTLGLYVLAPLSTQNLNIADLNRFREQVRQQIIDGFQRLQVPTP